MIYFKFKGQWHKVREYAPVEMQAEIKRHRTGLFPKRQSFTQSEFETICRQVPVKHPSVIDARFTGTGTVALAVSVAGKGEFLSHRTPLQGKEPGQ